MLPITQELHRGCQVGKKIKNPLLQRGEMQIQHTKTTCSIFEGQLSAARIYTVLARIKCMLVSLQGHQLDYVATDKKNGTGYIIRWASAAIGLCVIQPDL